MLLLLTRPFRLIGLAITVALVVGGIWLWSRATHSDPVGDETALAEFRARGGVVGERGRGVPRPGVYVYRQNGEERGGVGPAQIRRDLPDQAVYIVNLTPDGFQEDLQLSVDHRELVRYRATPEGLRAVARETEVDLLGVGRDDRRDLRPPPLDIAADLSVGSRWGSRYMAGELVIDTTSRVTARRTATVDGRRVDVAVIRVDGSFSGPFTGHRRDTILYSPDLSLPVVWHIDQEVGGLLDFDTRTSLRLTSARPRT